MSVAEQGEKEDEARPLTVIPDANVLIHGIFILLSAELSRL